MPVPKTKTVTNLEKIELYILHLWEINLFKQKLPLLMLQINPFYES